MNLTTPGNMVIILPTATQLAVEVESSKNQGESRLSRFFYVYLVMVGAMGGLISRWFLDPVFQPFASAAQLLKEFGGSLITIKETYNVQSTITCIRRTNKQSTYSTCRCAFIA